MNVFVENEVNIWKKKRRQALKRELSAYKLVLFFFCRSSLAKVFYWDPEI